MQAPHGALRLAAALCLLLALLPSCATAASRARFLAESPAAEAPAVEVANVTAFDRRTRFVRPGLAAAAAAAAAAHAWLPAGTFGGDGTAYSEAVPNTGKGFACSFRYLNDWASKHFAAINQKQWEDGLACGRCVTAWCVDERCRTRNQKVQVMITDLCPECKHGDVDFSIPVYRDITGMWPHRLAIKWEWSDCANQTTGGIRLDPKDGTNNYWRAWWFSNMRYPLKSVFIDGHPLERQQFGFWHTAKQLSGGPVTFTFVAQNGARVNATCADPLRAQDLDANFA